MASLEGDNRQKGFVSAEDAEELGSLCGDNSFLKIFHFGLQICVQGEFPETEV